MFALAAEVDDRGAWYDISDGSVDGSRSCGDDDACDHACERGKCGDAAPSPAANVTRVDKQ